MEASRVCFMAESSRAGEVQYEAVSSMGMAKSIMVAGTLCQAQSSMGLAGSRMVAGTVQHGGWQSPSW